MGRPSEGWTIKRPEGRRCFIVTFSHAGRQYKLGTGEEGEDAAARAAALIYAETITGKRAPRRRGTTGVDCRPLRALGADWLSSIAQTIDPTTAATYAGYVDAHFVPFFGGPERATLEKVTHGAVANYIRARLKCVVPSSVGKELGALRGLLAFALNIDRKAVQLPAIPTRAVGTSHKQGKRTRTPLSPDEIQAVIAKLPETRARRRSRAELEALGLKRAQYRYSRAELLPVRARYIIAYETSLRTKALNRLSVPEHYTKGSTHLRITREIDKARFARVVPLSAAARSALDAICPESGLLLGKWTSRKLLRTAARKAGIDAARVKTLHDYDLRAARLTHWAEKGNLPGVQWLAGHKKLSTTAIYAQGSLRSAEAALAAETIQLPPE